MNVLEKIEKMRIARGWSVYRLAELSGLTDKCIYNWYRRNTTPTIETLDKVCTAFGITLSQFFSNGDLVELDDELKHLFNDWTQLTQKQKDAIKVIIKTYIQ